MTELDRKINRILSDRINRAQAATGVEIAARNAGNYSHERLTAALTASARASRAMLAHTIGRPVRYCACGESLL